jgi:hypothetical protein
MLNFKRDKPPEGFEDVEAVLRELRPELPEDRVRLAANRAKAAAISGHSRHIHRKDSFMRSRITILLMLVFGFAFSGAGATLAVSGSGGDATVSQQGTYGTTQTPPTLVPPAGAPPARGVEGETEESDDSDEGGGAAPAESNQPVAPDVAPEVQVTRQASADTTAGELPFTGFAAIPILLIGVFLLASGLVLGRRARSIDGQ